MGQRNLIEDLPSDLIPMIPGFLERREREVVELELLLAKGDFIGIRFIGHRLKGTGTGFGFPVISEIGRQLELGAKAENRARVQEFIENLSTVTQILKSNL